MPVKHGLSVDPGDQHVGVAVWEDDVCVRMFETTPDRFVRKFWNSVVQERDYDWVAMESFRLRADKAKQKSGSDFTVVKLIGYCEFTCLQLGIEFRLVTPAQRAATWEKAKAAGFRFDRDPAGHATSAVCVGLVATGWRAVRHEPGTGVRTA